MQLQTQPKHTQRASWFRRRLIAAIIQNNHAERGRRPKWHLYRNDGRYALRRRPRKGDVELKLPDCLLEYWRLGLDRTGGDFSGWTPADERRVWHEAARLVFFRWTESPLGPVVATDTRAAQS